MQLYVFVSMMLKNANSSFENSVGLKPSITHITLNINTLALTLTGSATNPILITFLTYINNYSSLFNNLATQLT